MSLPGMVNQQTFTANCVHPQRSPLYNSAAVFSKPFASVFAAGWFALRISHGSNLLKAVIVSFHVKFRRWCLRCARLFLNKAGMPEIRWLIVWRWCIYGWGGQVFQRPHWYFLRGDPFWEGWREPGWPLSFKVLLFLSPRHAQLVQTMLKCWPYSVKNREFEQHLDRLLFQGFLKGSREQTGHATCASFFL